MAYGRTADAHAYMARVANHSTKGSKRGFVDIETGIDPASLLTPAQRRDNLKRKHEALGRQREAIQKARGGKDEWKRLGREMQQVQDEISALNKLIVPTRSFATFDAYFVSCAQTMLTTQDYGRICEAARRRQLEDAAQ